jgi:hypothetical protein
MRERSLYPKPGGALEVLPVLIPGYAQVLKPWFGHNTKDVTRETA